MFTLAQINAAHEKVKTGADFPQYMEDLIELKISTFAIWVADNHAVYQGVANHTLTGPALYVRLPIASTCDKVRFLNFLSIHQRGQTDYLTFCAHCAQTGIAKWIVDLNNKVCTYYDGDNKLVYQEAIGTTKA